MPILLVSTKDKEVPMKYLTLAVVLLTGCRTYQCCHTKPNPVKWSAESGLSTSVYPNAPYDGREYIVEKLDVSIKLRREW